MSSIENFMRSEVYDLAVQAGTMAYIRNIEKTQISNIIETFESEADPDSSIKITITFIARQMGRNHIKEDVGRTIINHLIEINRKFRGVDKRNAARKYLYLMRWVFESRVARRRLNNFQEFIEFIYRGR